MLKKDVEDLPPHIKQAVKDQYMKEAVKDGPRATRDLHAAATHLGHKRKAYENAILARSQLHSNWKRFLHDAGKLWQDYAAQFAAQEQKLAAQVVSAREDFMTAKAASAKAHEEAGTIQEISDEEIGELTSAPSKSAQQITYSMADLSKSLDMLHQQAQAITPADEVPIAKRPRHHSPKDEDHVMEQDPGNEHFGKAG